MKNLQIFRAVLGLLLLSQFPIQAEASFECRDRSGQRYFSDTLHGLPAECWKRIQREKMAEQKNKEALPDNPYVIKEDPKPKVKKPKKSNKPVAPAPTAATKTAEPKKAEPTPAAKPDGLENRDATIEGIGKVDALLKRVPLPAGRKTIPTAKPKNVPPPQPQPMPQQASSGEEDMAGMVFSIVPLILFLVMLVGAGKVFSKAGRSGLAIIVPFYNVYVLCKIAGKPGWWLVLYLIPLVNVVASIIVCIGVAKNFGKSAGFGIGLAFIPMIFYPILGFGKAKYSVGSDKA